MTEQSSCAGTSECFCFHCEEVRANERKRIATFLREKTTSFTAPDPVGATAWGMFIYFLAEIVERNLLEGYRARR